MSDWEFLCLAAVDRDIGVTSADEAGGDFDLICSALQLYNMNANHDGQTNAAEPRLAPNLLPPSENKIFRKWRREFSLLTGYGIDSEERVFAISRRNCERWKKDLLNYSTFVFPLHLYISLTGDVRPTSTVHAQTPQACRCSPHASSHPLLTL